MPTNRNATVRPAIRLAVLGVLSALIYWLALVRPANLFAQYGEPRADLYYLFTQGLPGSLRLVLAFGALAVLYLQAWRTAGRMSGRAAWLVMLGMVPVFSGLMLCLNPFDAADIYDSIIHGRMTGVYGANPFTHVPAEFPEDPFIEYIAWSEEPAPYGPVWEALAGLGAWLAARVEGNPILVHVIVFKFLPGLFTFASITVVALTLHRVAPEQALPGTLLLAWNPVVVYEAWGNGHNDMVMVFFVLLACLAVMAGSGTRRYTLAALALVAGALVKFLPLLLLPAVGLMAWSELKDWPSRVRFLVVTGGLCLLLTGLIYAPFWEGAEVVTLNRRTQLFTASLPAAVYHLLQLGMPRDRAAEVAGAIALAATALFALWQGWRAARRSTERDAFPQAAFNILAFFLLVTCLWFQQWYTVWLVALAPLLASPASRGLAILFSFTALGKQFVFFPLLIARRDRLPQPWLEILFALGVLGPAWVYYLLSKVRGVLLKVEGLKVEG
jgi:hypothetical protein